jgi:hypothetical protein
MKILGEAQDDLIRGFRVYESRLRMKIVLKSGGNSIDCISCGRLQSFVLRLVGPLSDG